MLFEHLKNAIDNSCADDEKLIRVQGVRDGRTFVIYEAWTSRDEFVISVAEEGSRDYERVMFDEEERKRKERGLGEWEVEEESQDSPSFIMYLLSTQIHEMIREKKAQKRELSREIRRLQEIRDDMRWEEINGDV